VLEELNDSRSPSATIARLVGEDPGLSVKVLQLANSSLFGQGRLISSPLDAVSCLGTDLIAAIILSQSIFRHYESLQHEEIDLARVWSHCQETACLAQHLCAVKKLPRSTGEEAFLAGLLHEVGRFVIIDNFPAQFQAACDAARETKTPLTMNLRQTLQATPATLSGYLLELWGLPGAVSRSITLQDHPEEDPAPGFSLTSALYIADRLASQKFPPDSFPLEDWKTDYLKAIGCAGEIAAWEKLPARG
jgi:HD-like signal output (HDOD) protein